MIKVKLIKLCEEFDKETQSPKLFTLALEDAFKSMDWKRKGIKIGGCYLNRLVFANDIVLISDNLTGVEKILNELNTASNEIGLKRNKQTQ